jgi:hypothetical protein
MVFNCGGKLNSSKVKRKTFVAREDLLYRVSEMAKQRGYTVYDMVNMIFELAVKAEAAGVDMRARALRETRLQGVSFTPLHTMRLLQ